MKDAPVAIARVVSIVGLSGVLAISIDVDGGLFLEGYVSSLTSIINAAGIAMALYIIATIGKVVDPTIERLRVLRQMNSMPPMTSAEVEAIMSSFRSSTRRCRLNAIALIGFLGVVAVITIWSRCDLPLLAWPRWTVTKLIVIYWVAFMSTGFSLMCVYDLTVTAFELAKLELSSPLPTGAHSQSKATRGPSA